ncbi:hypothetical protein [Pseudoclavibacter sp. VKM Ac-2888]|uniref:hypothetical protein n=1 Tax=Pseudoclavibacter sp. VKM Ac-2888 TaxID=2783830 RepID=UPI00188B3DAA|nr:hypothetical protein [Pseudoclavibacter sp. VKM Ac-2888]MBF4549686.1 hypothetical protein [Pseudoclavibacter sp. VKM Ac-2888]
MASKTVRIYRVVLIDQHGIEIPPPKTYWDRIFKHHAPSDGLAYGTHIFVDAAGITYEGQLRLPASVSDRHVYLGRGRDRLDWPDRRTRGTVEISPLADDAETQAVFEPLRLKPISGTDFVAVVRSYAGAHPTALEAWLNDAYSKVKPGITTVLRPHTRTDQVERLQAAVGVSRVVVSVEGTASDGNTIEAAAAELQEEVGYPLRIDIVMSMGNAKDANAFGRLLDLASGFVNGRTKAKAEATLLEMDDDGEITRDVVNFFSDKVAYAVEVKTDDVGDAEYLRVLDEAIRRFRASS